MYSSFKCSLRKHFILAVLCLLISGTALAQSTTVSGQVTDLGGQAWNSGTFTFQFIPNNNFLSSTYSWTGGVLNQTITGSLNATGGYSQSVPSNTSITPSLSQWRLQVCSGTTPVNCFSITQTITGGSQTVNVTPTSITVPPGAGNTAYVTSEVSPAAVGSQIYIIGSGLQICSTVVGGVCTVWTGASSSSSLGPYFNIKSYGAFGDTQAVTTGFVWDTGLLTVTCASCAFTSANAGAQIYTSGLSGPATGAVITGTIGSVVGGVAQITNQVNQGGGAASFLVWGHLDDPAATAVSVPLSAAANKVSVGGSQGYFVLGSLTPSPTLYLPSGGYMFCGTNAVPTALNITGNGNISIIGDGPFQTIIYPCGAPPLTPTNGSLWMPATSYLRGITIEGAGVGFSNRYAALMPLGSRAEDIACANASNLSGSTVPCLWASGAGRFYNVQVTQSLLGLFVTGSQTEFYATTLSNNTQNLLVSNITGGLLGAGSSGVRFFGGLFDECGSTVSCETLTNSIDVYFSGTSMFGASATANAVSVDGQSQAHFTDVTCGSFSAGGCVTVANGGKVNMFDSRMFAISGNCITNNGIIIDEGGNSCFRGIFASATQAANTVTLSTGATAHGLAIGDIIYVYQMSPTGYNGSWTVSAVPSTTTVQYVTTVSGLGAGSGGIVGGLPRSLVAGNAPIPVSTQGTVNYFIPTDTAQTWAQWTPNQGVNVLRVQIQSSNIPACTVAPVFRLTNGTVTRDVNLSLGNAATDSGIITSIFPPGTPITISMNAIGTCTTAPLNLNVNILWSSSLQF